jgi:phosphoglycolate phosphatase
MSLPFKAALFDLDGTLADTLADIGGSMNHVLEGYGFPTHGIDAYKTMLGEGLELLARLALPPGREALVADALLRYRAHYAEHFADQSAPYPGVAELLDGLSALELPLAVLSNKRDDFTRACVERLLPRWRFSEVRGERAGTPRKPDPQAALEIARALGVPVAECAFIGDTRVDMETAVNAGMLPVGALWGYRTREELVASGARVLLAHPLDLLQPRSG